MASVVNVLGRGGQRFAEKMLGWSRGTIRKGQKELEQGEAFAERFSERGRKPIEESVKGAEGFKSDQLYNSESLRPLKRVLPCFHWFTSAQEFILLTGCPGKRGKISMIQALEFEQQPRHPPLSNNQDTHC